jgi:hypothetical protein
MANEKANDTPVNPNPVGLNTENETILAQRPVGGGPVYTPGNPRPGSIEIIHYGLKLFEAYGRQEQYIQAASEATKDVLGSLAVVNGPQSGVAVYVIKDQNNNFAGFNVKAGNNPDQAFGDQVYPPGYKSTAIWIPKHPEEAYSPNIGQRVTIMSPQEFSEAFGFRRLRSDAGSPDEGAPSLASKDTKQIMAELNITSTDRQYFKLEGQQQSAALVATQTANPTEPKPTQVTAEAPTQDAPSRPRLV